MSLNAVPDQSDYCQRNGAGTAVVATSYVLLSLATIAISARLWTRLVLKGSTFGIDDICLITAYVLMIPATAVLLRMSDLGLGRRKNCYSDHDLIHALKLEYISEFLLIISSVFSRASVALFVTRLFAVTRRVRIALYCFTVFVCISITVTACLVFALCTPIQALWNYHLRPQAKCWSEMTWLSIDYYNSAVSILSDFVLAMLPAYFLSKLQMARNLKIGIGLLMAIGLIPMICAIYRTAWSTTQPASEDPLYSSAILMVSGSVECWMLVICASVMALRPFFRLLHTNLHRLKSSRSASSNVLTKRSISSESNRDPKDSSSRTQVKQTCLVHHSETDPDNNVSQVILGDLAQNHSCTV